MSISRNFDCPNVGVGLGVIREGHVLLHLRKGKHSPNTWAFPGGHLEKWEQFGECARRELVEEAGPEIEIGRMHYWDVMNTMFIEEGKHYVVIFLWADWISGDAQVMEPTKNAGWKWWPWDSLPENSMQGLGLLKKYHPHLP